LKDIPPPPPDEEAKDISLATQEIPSLDDTFNFLCMLFYLYSVCGLFQLGKLSASHNQGNK
jgi:hypothetical protein